MSELRLSIVIPSHNEEESLPATIHALAGRLSAEGIDYEIVVVDDHSTDGTAEVLAALSRQYPAVRAVQNRRSGGFGQAIHTGMDAFEGDAVCVVMADGSDDPRDVVQYYRKLLEGYECVFGSRFTPQSSVINYPKHKLLLNRVVNFFIRLIFGLQYNDVTNAFKCYRRNVIDGVRPLLSHHFNLTVELPLKAIVRGYSYAVVPIHWYGRAHGVSKLRIQEMGSRYLFIVLYVLLERLLSRGDYVRPGEAGVVERRAIARRESRGPGWAWLSIVIVATLQMLFVYTYPLNHKGGDTSGYEHVVMNKTSNLLFAPGYTTLAGLPLRVDWIGNLVTQHKNGFREILQFCQHAFEVLCLVLLLITLSRIYNRTTAFLSVLIAGTSARAMGVNSSVYPEWLQADLLIVAFCLGALAFTTRSRWLKPVLYMAAFGAFTWCVLAKFNSIFFAPGLLVFFLFEQMPWKRRGKIFAAAALFALVNYLGFVTLIQKRETGTFALTYDKSWVLLTKLALVYDFKLPHQDGISTKRWLALSALLPPRYDVASVGIFMKTDSVPADIRKTGWQTAGYVLTADEKVLDDVLRRHPLPPTFNLAVSSIPVSYFIGLKQSDELGVKVFWDNVLHEPGTYVSSVWDATVKSFARPSTEPTFPTVTNVTGVEERLIPTGPHLARLKREPASQLPYDADEPIIWTPGFAFFSGLAHMTLPRRVVAVLIFIGLLVSIVHGVRYGWSLRSAAAVVLALLLGGFVLFSNAVLEFRWKEWRLAYPVASVLLGVTFGWALPEAVRKGSRAVTGKAETESEELDAGPAPEPEPASPAIIDVAAPELTPEPEEASAPPQTPQAQ